MSEKHGQKPTSLEDTVEALMISNCHHDAYEPAPITAWAQGFLFDLEAAGFKIVPIENNA